MTKSIQSHTSTMGCSPIIPGRSSNFRINNFQMNERVNCLRVWVIKSMWPFVWHIFRQKTISQLWASYTSSSVSSIFWPLPNNKIYWGPQKGYLFERASSHFFKFANRRWSLKVKSEDHGANHSLSSLNFAIVATQGYTIVLVEEYFLHCQMWSFFFSCVLSMTVKHKLNDTACSQFHSWQLTIYCWREQFCSSS